MNRQNPKSGVMSMLFEPEETAAGRNADSFHGGLS